MADGDRSGGNTGIVAIVVIFVIVLLLAFFAYSRGMFGGRGGGNTNINITTPRTGGSR